MVIRCRNDPRVFDCVESAEGEAEIMVSISPGDALQGELESRGVPFCVSPPGNLSVTSNAGIEASRTEKVIVTDSDTVLGEGTASAMSQALDAHMVCRARLVFELSEGLALSGPVSRARDFVNSKRLAFTPGLGLRKGLRDSVGGMLFDEAAPFAVDANLNFRIDRAGVEVLYLDDFTVTHRAESVKHDLRAANRIGNGVARSSRSLHGMYGGEIPEPEIRRSLKAVHVGDYPDIVRRHGLSTAAYQAVWDLSFYLGEASFLIGGGR